MSQAAEENDMAEGRGLLTDNEREALAGERTYEYRHKTRSYFRKRVERVHEDVEILAEHDPELLELLQDAVCSVEVPEEDDGRE